MTAPDPHELIAEAEALAAKATPGPWDGDETGRLVLARTDRGDGYFRTEHIAEALDPSARRERGHNLAFIAASRTLVPAICAALREALAENERLRAEVERHFVHFLSPGFIASGENRRPIEAWDVGQALAMLRREVAVDRFFGFQFSTRARGPSDLDSREVARSSTYFLGGRIETLEEIAARGDPKDEILLSNMRSNNWPRVVRNSGSFGQTFPLRDGDVVLPEPQPEDPAQ